MSKFTELLKQSVAKVNEGFEKAQDDLLRLSAELADSVGQLGNFTIVVNALNSDVKGTTYRLAFDPDQSDLDGDLIRILTVNIPSGGYPISYGTYNKAMDEFRALGKIADSEALNQYFESMLEDPTSQLVQAVGFAMRKTVD